MESISMCQSCLFRTVSKLWVGIVIFAFAVQSKGDSISSLFNTGVDGANVVRPDEQPETHYVLTQIPSGSTGLVVQRSSGGGFPFPPWSADDGISAWIKPA